MRSRAIRRAPGQRFARLTIVELAYLRHGYKHWNCMCDCGKIVTVDARNIATTNSCGCFKREKLQSLYMKPIMDIVVSQNFNSYKQGARVRRLSWGLTREQFRTLILAPCYYCGDAAGTTTKQASTGRAAPNNGVDRMDSALGYSIDNCVTACKICNIAKRRMSVDQFIAWARRLVAHQDQHV